MHATSVPRRIQRARSGAIQHSERASAAHRLLRATARSPGCACGGVCPRCSEGHAAARVSRPADPLEQQADRAADALLRGSHAPARAAADAGGGRDGSTRFARLPVRGGAGSSPATTGDGRVDAALRSPGRALGAEARAFFEPRLGRDLSHVRVHTDADAAASAQKVDALAYTVGPHIAFAPGRYAPATSAGRRLLAHELVHVTQSGGPGSGPGDRAVIQRACAHDEAFYRDSPAFCRDATFSPITHAGSTCYREIPSRSSLFDCPASQHVCFDAQGECEDSPDVASSAAGREPDGTCRWNWYCVAQHIAEDFLPALGLRSELLSTLVGLVGLGGQAAEAASEAIHDTADLVEQLGDAASDLLEAFDLGGTVP
jgi:hypothetical protein